MIKKLLFFSSFILLVNSYLIAKERQDVDSLKNIINTEQNDSIKIIKLLELGDIFEHSIPDTALNYYNNALRNARNIKNNVLIARCSNYIGIVYSSLSDYNRALIYFQESLEINKNRFNMSDQLYMIFKNTANKLF